MHMQINSNSTDDEYINTFDFNITDICSHDTA